MTNQIISFLLLISLLVIPPKIILLIVGLLRLHNIVLTKGGKDEQCNKK